ncbi:MAG: FIST N-terminal domain-containing protein, partial [Dehalococcoidia bacterium]
IIPFLADDPSSAGGTIQELTKDRLSQGAAGNAFLLLLSDIFSIRAPELLDSLNRDMGYFPIVGAAASGHPEDKATVQWAASRHTKHGLAGALFSGPIQHRTRVSPGCEPIGEPFVITGAEGMVIKEIGNRPAYDTLQDALAIFPPEEMERVSKGILAGILFDEHKYPPKRGDYLARSIASVDPEAGTITIVENVRPGQTLQFQVRNPSTAREELETEVRGISWDSGLKTPLFAFYFESLGRGGRVHKEPDHDLKIIKEGLGEVPIIGFLSNAEFTPRNSRNLVHNYSAALTVVFRQGKKSAKKK